MKPQDAGTRRSAKEWFRANGGWVAVWLLISTMVAWLVGLWLDGEVSDKIGKTGMITLAASVPAAAVHAILNNFWETKD